MTADLLIDPLLCALTAEWAWVTPDHLRFFIARTLPAIPSDVTTPEEVIERLLEFLPGSL